MPQPADLLALAQATRKRGNPRQALQLLSGFERKFHSDKIIPDIYFFYGSVLCQDLRQDNLAIRFFNALCTLYPQHERVAEAQRLIVTLNRMSTQKTD